MALPPRLRAALIVPTGVDMDRWIAACVRTAESHRWQVTGLVHDWDTWVRLAACENLVDVGVVGTMAHLPPDRLPRIVATDRDQPPEPGLRRPHITLPPA